MTATTRGSGRSSRAWEAGGRRISCSPQTTSSARPSPVRAGHDLAVKVGRYLYAGKMARIHCASPAEEKAAFEYLARHKDKEYSFTDCLSFVVMDAFGITEAWAVDADFTHRFAVKPGARDVGVGAGREAPGAGFVTPEPRASAVTRREPPGPTSSARNRRRITPLPCRLRSARNVLKQTVARSRATRACSPQLVQAQWSGHGTQGRVSRPLSRSPHPRNVGPRLDGLGRWRGPQVRPGQPTDNP